jgi:carbamoyl-phosphate synthase large subunit
MAGERVLVTGAGGVAGVNFVRALRASSNSYYVAGTDYSRYYIELPDLDARYHSPRHDSGEFVERIAEVARKERVEFIHPQPSSEAFVLASKEGELPAPIFLPGEEVMETGQDKLLTREMLASKSVPVAKTKTLRVLSEVDSAFDEIGAPVWVRARHGAGGRFSLLCQKASEARQWVGLWVDRGVGLDEFMLQSFLPGRNIAWDSLWKGGKLVTSYCRERIEYPFKHVSPSGITGTPSVARTVHDASVNRVSQEAVKAIAPNAKGAFSIDIKEDGNGRPVVTEVDAGKFHTTMPLWGYVGVKRFGLPWYANLADLYVRMGLGEDPPGETPRTDLFPEGYYMIRNMDSGMILWREDGTKERVL